MYDRSTNIYRGMFYMYALNQKVFFGSVAREKKNEKENVGTYFPI